MIRTEVGQSAPSCRLSQRLTHYLLADAVAGSGQI